MDFENGHLPFEQYFPKKSSAAILQGGGITASESYAKSEGMTA